MLVFGWILMGAGVGIVASVLSPARGREATFVYPVLGVMGAVIGGVAAGVGAALAGAAVIVVLYAVSSGRSPRGALGRAR